MNRFYIYSVKKALFIFALFLTVQGFAQKSLTLRQCVELAWANNLQIKQAQLSVESSEASLQNTKADVLPNLNGFASHNYNWGQRIDPFTNQFANTRVQREGGKKVGSRQHSYSYTYIYTNLDHSSEWNDSFKPCETEK